MTTRPPTPQAISALLRKAGFKRSEQIRGYYDSDGSGFRVTADLRPGVVLVSHHFWAGPGDAKPWIAKYAGTIKAAGWSVETGEYELTVTAGSAEQ